MIVYLVTNTINGKRYVGQTSNSLEERRKQHLKISSGCLALRSALVKYGFENFEFSSLFEDLNLEQANYFEKEYIDRYKTKAPNGYNLTDGGEGVSNPSLETRTRMSISQTGKKAIRRNKIKKVAGAKRTKTQFPDYTETV